jgi:RNA polymerase sigma-70 factor (ECF subfamily)
VLPEASPPADLLGLGSKLRDIILARYRESKAERYSIVPEGFLAVVAAVIARYGADFSESEKLKLVASLRVEELVLARACSAGNNAAWDDFMAHYRPALYQSARFVTRDDDAARELADGLYAELWGLPNRDGRRISKFDYYMGRGSLQGWLRTVLSQQHIDRCRSLKKDVSLDEQIEAGVPFAAKPDAPLPIADHGLTEAVAATFAELGAEDRFLLASYYLDQQTLAAIGRQLGVHESTVSRKLEKLTSALQKQIRKRLQAAGMDARQCDELLQELDVRDLNLDVAGNLQQERSVESF